MHLCRSGEWVLPLRDSPSLLRGTRQPPSFFFFFRKAANDSCLDFTCPLVIELAKHTGHLGGSVSDLSDSRFRLRSWSYGLWDGAPSRALGWRHGSYLGFSLSAPPPACMHALSLSLTQNKYFLKSNWQSLSGKKRRWGEEGNSLIFLFVSSDVLIFA